MVPVNVSLVSEGNLNLKRDGHSKKPSHSLQATSEQGTGNGDEPGLRRFSSSRNHTSSKNRVHSNVTNRSSDSGSETGGAKTSWRKFLAGVLFGHAPNADEILGSFGSPVAAVAATFLQSILYSISNTVFASNLLSGLLILISMSWSAPYPSVVPGLVSCLSGTFTSLWVLRFPRQTTIRGTITFNCFLFGSLLSSLTGLTFSLIYQMIYLILIALMAGVLVVLIWGGLNGVLLQANLPVLSAPTNLLSLLLISSGMKDMFRSSTQELSLSSLLYNSNTTMLPIHEPERLANLSEMLRSLESIKSNVVSQPMQSEWIQLFQGVIFSQGQIFQTTDSIVATWAVWLSVFIYSPILCFQEFIGASIGSFLGWLITENPHTDVYNGTWGFNAMLTCGALGGFLIAYDIHSFCLSVIASLITTLLQYVLWKNGCPVLGIPFMITTWIILPLTNEYPGRYELNTNPVFYRVLSITTPELNRKCCRKSYIAFPEHKSKYFRPASSVLPV